LFKCKDKWKTK